MTIGVMLGTPEGIGSATLFYSQSVASESLTSPATPSTVAGKRGQVWRIRARADVFIEFGTSPDGAGATRWELATGDVIELAVTAEGEKVAYATS